MVSKNILVADDSLFFRTKLSDILVEAGHKVRFARDGKEVINEISGGPGVIDLLVMDLQMPEVDGFGVLKWIAENGHKDRFPILAITGAYEAGDVMEQLKKLGANGLMPKSSTPEQIVFRINRILFPDKASGGAPRGRVPTSIPVDFTIGNVTRTGFLLNISGTGAYLHTSVDLLTGAKILLKFSLPTYPKVLEIRSSVVWATAEVAKSSFFGGYGIEFNAPSEEDLTVIKAYIEKESKKIDSEKK